MRKKRILVKWQIHPTRRLRHCIESLSKEIKHYLGSNYEEFVYVNRRNDCDIVRKCGIGETLWCVFG